ncbi:hypothetical protein M1146_05305 [Patescibacteria group bacterium]|nr:hypothetical protein [Patescibacteria group bacterium]
MVFDVKVKFLPLNNRALAEDCEKSVEEEVAVVIVEAEEADVEGGLLREVQMIEVDKIKSKVSAYKSHKDLVRKERLEEKEIHLSKTEDAMTRTTEWRTYEKYYCYDFFY